jgi:tRNA threonylcarbamoyladenosine biosynthesis protein TsaE
VRQLSLRLLATRIGCPGVADDHRFMSGLGRIDTPVRSLTLKSGGEAETRAIGSCLAVGLHGGELLALTGDLGSGKTCFVRGLAEGLGIVPRKVRSPTFTLVAEYLDGRLPLYHIDLYRIDPSALDRLALREYLYGDGVCAVEWFERLGESPPRLDLHFTFVGANQRLVVVSAIGERYDGLLDCLRDGI